MPAARARQRRGIDPRTPIPMPTFGRTGARALARLAADRRGAAAVEFALLLPMLALLLAGLFDVSRLISASMQVRAAAQAGADFARTHGWDAAKVETAARSATPLAGVTAAPAAFQGCASGGGIVPAPGPACAGGAPAGSFVAVAASAPFRPLAPWPEVVLPDEVRARAVVRIG